ncbi:neutral amino acid transporter 9-like [Ambystoma mexicanum]|uniref:neutral amino acid transporter 9-like n=1 Tax=Ambystoma mexicanum TaxID=8296 RepID=UPI0037E77AC9
MASGLSLRLYVALCYVMEAQDPSTNFYENASLSVRCGASIFNPNQGDNGTSTLCSPERSCSNLTTTSDWERWWHKRDSVPFYLIILVLPLMNFRSAGFFSKLNNLEFSEHFPVMSGTMMLAFFIHNCLYTLMKNNAARKNVRDLCIAYLLVSLTYLYIGIMFFIAFPTPPFPKTCISQNLLDNLPLTDVWGMIGRLLLLFQLMTVYPLLAFVIRVQLFKELFGNVYPSFFHVFALNILLVVIGSLFGKFFPNVGSIIRYSGAVCGLVFIFIFPFLIHLINLHRKGQRTVLTTIFHIFLILLGLANLIGQFLV